MLVQVKTRDWPGARERQALAAFPAPPNTRKLLHRWRARQRMPDVFEVALPMKPPQAEVSSARHGGGAGSRPRTLPFRRRALSPLELRRRAAVQRRQARDEARAAADGTDVMHPSHSASFDFKERRGGRVRPPELQRETSGAEHLAAVLRKEP